MMSLSNREIAWLIWLGIGLVALLTQEKLREAVWHVLRAFCAPKILISIGIMLLYVGVCILLLSALQLWQWDNLKTTLLWCATFAFVTMIDIGRISEDDTFYKKTFRDAVSATAILIFIAEVKSFSLWIEFLLVPVLLFLGVLLAVAQTRPEGQEVRGLIEGFVAFVGLGLLIAGAIAIWSNPTEFVTWASIREFLVPIILTLLFLPFIYVLSTYVVFEQIFLRISFLWPDDKLRRYAYNKAILAFTGDLDALRRWKRNIGVERPSERSEVDRTIREVLETKQREKSPSDIPVGEGWSPYEAKAFLDSEGFKTDDYHKSYDDAWHASSKPVEIDNAILPSRVKYSIKGNKIAATRLKLSLKTFITVKEDVADKDEAKQVFSHIAELLARAAIPDIAAGQISNALSAGANQLIRGTHADIQTWRKDWENANLKGFELLLCVTHHSHDDADDDFETQF